MHLLICLSATRSAKYSNVGYGEGSVLGFRIGFALDSHWRRIRRHRCCAQSLQTWQVVRTFLVATSSALSRCKCQSAFRQRLEFVSVALPIVCAAHRLSGLVSLQRARTRDGMWPTLPDGCIVAARNRRRSAKPDEVAPWHDVDFGALPRLTPIMFILKHHGAGRGASAARATMQH